jgi:hypothetical protein
MSKIETINDHFQLPISYNSSKIKLNDTIITDLELIKTINESISTKHIDSVDCTDNKCSEPDCIKTEILSDTKQNCDGSMFNYAFNPQSVFGKKVLEQFPQYYTTDKEFLKDSQILLKTYTNNNLEKPDYSNILSIWNEVKLDKSFIEKYQYIDIDYFKYLNNSDHFLQIMSMYNLSSPVFSILVPVFLLIIPFFIIQIRGLQITVNEYIEVLKQIAANHAIGKLFTNFNQVDNQQKIYLLISAGFYLFSIYQNVLTCLKFHNNMFKMHTYLDTFKKYIEYTVTSMKNLLSYSNCLNTYSNFNNVIQSNINILNEFHIQLNIIIPYKLSPYTIGGLGHVLKCFYQLYENIEYNNAIMYSFGYNGYIDNLEGLIGNINLKYINFANFDKSTGSTIEPNDKEENNEKKSKKSKKDKKEKRDKENKEDKGSKEQIVNSYYPVLMHNTPVKNTCDMKNMIITGPNASGKTTTLKSILINVIITQQFGCGFYDNANFEIFDFVHCYLNIPDTSGRDSLFQAECRRCKEILDTIKKNDSSKTHLCVFDELYSGTNPDEAVMSSLAFMRFLIKHKNIKCILTTHFIKVCTELEEHKSITNFHMHTKEIEDKDKKQIDFKYTYKLEKGISSVKGGIKVLRDMNYPDEILNDSIRSLNK